MGLRSEAMSWIVFVPLVAALTLGLRGAVLFTLANISTAVVLYMVGKGDTPQFLAAMSLVCASVFSATLGATYEWSRLRAIGERDSQARRLREMGQRFLSVVEHLEDGIGITDEHARLVIVNIRMCEIFGVKARPATLVGQDAWQVIASGSRQPEDPEAFRARIIELAQMGRVIHGDTIPLTDGRVYDRTFVPITLGGQQMGHLWSYRDITRRHVSEQRAWARVHTDELTGSLSRAGLTDMLRADTQAPDPFALLFLDLDGFKSVNDQHGHETGDLLLTAVAIRLKSVVRTNDVVGRLGGDEFAIVLRGIADAGQAETAAGKVLSAFKESFELEGGIEVQIGGSIGVALYPSDARSRESLLRTADEAMYEAKRRGKNQYVMAGASLEQGA